MLNRCAYTPRLEQLVGGRLTVSALQELTAHLDECTSCQRRLEAILTAHPEVTEAARLLDRESPAQDATLLRLMQRMKDLANLARPATLDDKLLLAFLDPPLQPGQLGCVKGYAITEVIGRGGMGVVLKAIDPALERVVALKLLAPHLASNAAARRRFAREAKAASAVCHQHVVAIHAVEEAGPLPFLVMEYVPGISLQERLDATGPLALREILRIGMQTAAGLAAAHAQGLVHRDIKPANLLLENGVERVRISDFGLARAMDDASLTQSGVLAGTPQYMAPEQARGDPVDHRADLFSLGSVLYALCTGRPPFRASTTMGVLRRVRERKPRSIREINPDIPAWLVAIIEQLHAKDPAERFQSAAELSQVLGQCLAHVEQPEQVPLPAHALPPLSPRPAERRAFPLWQRALAVRSTDGMWQAVPFPLWQGALSLLVLLGLYLAIADWKEAGSVWKRLPTILSLNGPAMPATVVPGARLQRVSPERTGGVVAPAAAVVPGARLQRVSRRTSLPHPDGAVYAAAFSPGGELLATGSYDTTAKLWDLSTGQLRATLKGHTRAVWSVAFAGEGRLLATGAGDYDDPERPGEIKVWDVTTGEELFSLEGHGGLVFCVAFSPDSKTLASASADQTVRLWDLARRSERQVLRGHTSWVRSLAFSHNGQTLASGGFDGAVHLWDVATGLRRGTLPLHAGAANSLAFSPDDRTLAVAEFGSRSQSSSESLGQVTLWDPATGTERAVLQGNRAQMLSVAFSPDGKILATSGGDWTSFGEVRLWDLRNGWEAVELLGHTQWVECVAFSPDGKLLVSAGGTVDSLGEVNVWQVARETGP